MKGVYLFVAIRRITMSRKPRFCRYSPICQRMKMLTLLQTQTKMKIPAFKGNSVAVILDN